MACILKNTLRIKCPFNLHCHFICNPSLKTNLFLSHIILNEHFKNIITYPKSHSESKNRAKNHFVDH